MAWNGLSYRDRCRAGGRRSGAAIGFQQTVLSAIGIAAPVAFAAMVSGTSWSIAFALASRLPARRRVASSSACGAVSRAR